MQRRSRDIVEGQRYLKIGPGGGTWEVVAVRPDSSGAMHARMRSLVEPSTYRTFSIEVLADPRNFRPVDENEPRQLL